MYTGFDLLESSAALRNHWLRRFAAGFIDITIIFTPIWIVLMYVDVPSKIIVAGLGAGLVWFLYAASARGGPVERLVRHWCTRRWCPDRADARTGRHS